MSKDVLIVFKADNLLSAGDPKGYSYVEIEQHKKGGYSIEVVSYEEYKRRLPEFGIPSDLHDEDDGPI